MKKVGWKEILIAIYTVPGVLLILSWKYLDPYEPRARGLWVYVWIALLAAPVLIADRAVRLRRQRSGEPLDRFEAGAPGSDSGISRGRGRNRGQVE